MSFTYDLTSTGDALLISQVRLEIGDTVEDSGVLPSGGNLSDAEILLFLARNGSDVQRAAGGLCALLARQWAMVTDIAVGPRRESLSQVSRRWQDMAMALGVAETSFNLGVRRADGYAAHAGGGS